MPGNQRYELTVSIGATEVVIPGMSGLFLSDNSKTGINVPKWTPVACIHIRVDANLAAVGEDIQNTIHATVIDTNC